MSGPMGSIGSTDMTAAKRWRVRCDICCAFYDSKEVEATKIENEITLRCKWCSQLSRNRKREAVAATRAKKLAQGK